MEPPHFTLSQVVYHPDKGYDFTITEVRIIQYTICDYNVKEIADLLRSTEQNVYRHRCRMMDKTPAKSFEGFIALLLINRVFTSPEIRIE